MTRTRTTRYVTLLSFVLALALTAALAVCGSDEPSGVTGSDRTASIPTETLASAARTPSTPGSVGAPTATVPPGPAAATAPPAASGVAAEGLCPLKLLRENVLSVTCYASRLRFGRRQSRWRHRWALGVHVLFHGISVYTQLPGDPTHGQSLALRLLHRFPPGRL